MPCFELARKLEAAQEKLSRTRSIENALDEQREIRQSLRKARDDEAYQHDMDRKKMQNLLHEYRSKEMELRREVVQTRQNCQEMLDWHEGSCPFLLW